jgi:ubiquinone/menaquinone biosynthesis C-methylase UbiE
MAAAYAGSKYDAIAETFAERTYADPGRTFRHRFDLFRELGPPVEPPARVLELACGDGILAELLVRAGYDYTGIDSSRGMVEATRERLGSDARAGVADLNTYRPPEPVAATVCFAADYYASDRAAFLSRVAGYTERKLVFDFSPRQDPPERWVGDIFAAGFTRVALRPFFVPQSYLLPKPLQGALERLERAPRLARLILRWRFAYLCAAWRES